MKRQDGVWFVQIPFGAGNALVVCRSIIYRNYRVHRVRGKDFKGMAYCEEVLACYIPEQVKQRGNKFTDVNSFLLIDWQIAAKRMPKKKALAMFVSECL